ncbi:MAG: hypothetical protein GX868_14770, partial [Actinobacteria bacterium]|nr:hypothetical protein [Actinomycetota bacterium]
MTSPYAPTRVRQRMGDVLVDRGLLTQAQLDRRLLDQQQQGARLGKILLAAGDVTRRDLWSAMAETWGIDSIDLIATPPQPEVLALVDSKAALAGRWIPVRIDTTKNGRVGTVAVCDEPTDALTEQVKELLDVGHVQFVATTDWDIEQAVLAGFSEDMITRAAYELAEARPELSAADPVAAWQKVAGVVVPAFLIAASVLNWRV